MMLTSIRIVHTENGIATIVHPLVYKLLSAVLSIYATPYHIFGINFQNHAMNPIHICLLHTVFYSCNAGDSWRIKSANFIHRFSWQNKNQALLLNLLPILSADFIGRMSYKNWPIFCHLILLFICHRLKNTNFIFTTFTIHHLFCFSEQFTFFHKWFLS